MQLEIKKVTLMQMERKSPTAGKAKFTGSLTVALARAMGWGGMVEDKDGKSSFQFEFPMWQKQGTPIGKLLATQIDLEPKSGIAVGKSMTLETTLIDGFDIIRTEVKGKTAKKTRATKTDLTFSVHFSDNNGLGKLEKYFLTSNVDSSMLVVYEREPEQEELPGTQAGEEAGQAELEDLVQETARRRKKEKE